MLEDLIPIIAILAAVALPVACGTAILLNLLRNRHTERIELIKQGIVPESKTKNSPNRLIALRNGFLCVGVAVGAIVGLAFNYSVSIQKGDFFLVLVTSIVLFLGIAYIVYYYVSKDKFDEE